MNTETVTAVPLPSVIPPEIMADLEYAMHLAMTGQRDDAFARRVREESARITQDILAEHGVLNIAVDLIREGRDEE